MPPRRKAAQKTEPGRSTRGATKAKEEEEMDPSLLTVAKLREALEDRGLEITGKKPQLVARLKAALSDDGDEDTSAPKTKKSKKSQPEQSDFQKAKEILQVQDASKKKKSHSQRKVDTQIPNDSVYQVVEDWDCMLNQTNVGQNNNKYYIIQMLVNGKKFYVWNRWGRVGENGQTAMKGPFTVQTSAETDFKKKFKDKTRNNWDERDDFQPSAGKYTLLEMADSDSEDEIVMPVDTKSDSKPKKVKSCTLDNETQGLIKLIFDNDMFNNALQNFNIDVNKMPLGKLSKGQIAKGFDVLERLENELKANKTSKISDLSSEFYTVIPHSFGRTVPPSILSAELLQQKKDMLMVLGDIELALSMQKDKGKTYESLDEVPHPLDVNYGLLNTDLELLDSKSELYKILETYTNNTKSGSSIFGYGSPAAIQNIWKINRHPEFNRHKVHDNIKNRKLLWHGTNVAVVAAIIKDGLRIMPHSGGRVGRGIYFASEQMLSAYFVRPASNRIGIMFLNEVALGNEKAITVDDSSLKKAPSGFDSVVARGRKEPDGKLDTTITLDGRKVVVPQGKPVNQSQYSESSFGQSEYLVYEESQNRIRYLITFKM